MSYNYSNNTDTLELCWPRHKILNLASSVVLGVVDGYDGLLVKEAIIMFYGPVIVAALLPLPASHSSLSTGIWRWNGNVAL